MQDDVLVEPEVTRDFHGDRDAHRGDRRHDVNVVRSNYLREFGAGSRHELDPHVDGDQQRQGQLFVERDERESTRCVPMSTEYVRSPTMSEHT